RSSNPSGSWLMRTMRSHCRKSTARRALRTSKRAASFSLAWTESSRSRIIASAPCKAALTKYLGSLAGTEDPRARRAIAGRRLREWDSGWEHACALAQSGPPDRGFDARGNYKGQSAFIMDLNLGVPHPECLKHFFSLPVDRVAVIRFHSRLKLNVNAAALARFDAHVKIRPDLRARVA